MTSLPQETRTLLGHLLRARAKATRSDLRSQVDIGSSGNWYLQGHAAGQVEIGGSSPRNFDLMKQGQVLLKVLNSISKSKLRRSDLRSEV